VLENALLCTSINVLKSFNETSLSSLYWEKLDTIKGAQKDSKKFHHSKPFPMLCNYEKQGFTPNYLVKVLGLAWLQEMKIGGHRK